MTTFETLGLSAPILKALTAKNYAAPTPIQAKAIPCILSGRDLIGLAQTGTGKTAAFALPVLDRMAANRRIVGARRCRTLILAPTRELAAQIGESMRVYGRFIGLSSAVVFGGASINRQIDILARGVDTLVATPGRLIDLLERRSVSLDAVETLVLDEADHMLDIGFLHALRRIAALLPKQRQTVLFSATMPQSIAALAAQFLTDPMRVAAAAPSTPAQGVEQSVIHVQTSRKQDLLLDLMKDPTLVRGLVFTRTKHGADKLRRRLIDAGHQAEAIHGNKSQPQRERALQSFKNGSVRLLVATEVAARGLDINNVSHVINFDIPNVPEQYVHRIGRTARGGERGRAISFCSPEERPFLRDIERLTTRAVPVVAHPMGVAATAAGEGAPAARPRGQAPGGQRQPARSDGQKPARQQTRRRR
jgi:ATP-dependent RNA helicase RhlE